MARHGYVLIPPFDDRAVIAGQGTVGLEIAADCPQVGLVLVPVSGGGLISGIAAAVRAACPAAAVVGVEPELAADARESFRRGERVSWPSADVQRTVADALRVEQVGALPFAHIRELVAGMVTVTEDEMLAAVRLLASQARLVAEPGGAAAVAAWLYHRDELPEATHAGGGALRRQHRPDAAGRRRSPGTDLMLGPSCVPHSLTRQRGSCCSSSRCSCCTWRAPGACCCSRWRSW